MPKYIGSHSRQFIKRIATLLPLLRPLLKSKFATMKDIVRTVTEAQQRYFLTNGKYTTSNTKLDIEYPRDERGRISFNGGYCSLTWWPEPDEGIICILKTEPQIALANQYRASNIYCRVMYSSTIRTDSLQDKICQAETGRTTRSKKAEDGNIYYYK